MTPNGTTALAVGEGQTSAAAVVTAAATSAIQTTAPAHQQQQQQQPPPTTALAATHALDGSLLTKYNLMHHHGGIATMPLHHPFVHANGAFVQQPGGAIGIHHPAGAALVTRGDPRAFVGHAAVTMNPPPTAVFSPTITPSIPSADGTEVSNYKDYSKHTGDSMTEQQHAPSTTSSGKDPSFPVKLHRILSAADHEEFITWLPHGRSWRVLKPKAFEAKIIPLYFRHAKYASFMRQVNGWGFKRITQGPDHNSYYHELFLRGLPHLCHRMTRPPKTKNGATPPQDNNTVHPDFYHLSIVAPLPPAGGGPARQTQPQAPHQQFQPQSVYITSASSASPALTATEGSGERSSNYSDDVGGASDESASGKERGARVTRPTKGGRPQVASDSSSADSKEQDAGSDGANSVKNCSSSSSAYAGGSEGGGDSGSDSDPLSDDAPKQSLSQSKVAAHNKSMESSSSATSSSTVSFKGRGLQQPSKQEQASAPMVFPPTMLPPTPAAPMPMMQQFPGSNMPYIIVQQPPGAAPGQQQQQPMIVQQQAPQQQQLLRVVNQSGGEVGYIQMPQQPGMPMVQPQQMMQAAPGGFVQAAPGAQMAIQGMPGMQTYMPAMQPQMQPMMQQWPPQMQAMTPQQVQQMAMQQQQQMQQQMQMIHPSQMLATPQQMQQQQRFQQPLAFPTAPVPRK